MRAGVKADLRLRWAHRSISWFVMLRFISDLSFWARDLKKKKKKKKNDMSNTTSITSSSEFIA